MIRIWIEENRCPRAFGALPIATLSRNFRLVNTPASQMFIYFILKVFVQKNDDIVTYVCHVFIEKGPDNEGFHSIVLDDRYF